MRSRNFVICAIAMLAVLNGCASTPEQSQEQSGMIIGGILGGVLGAQVGRGNGRTVAIIAGTIIGSSIGGNVGRSMDESDRLKTAHVLESVRTGVPSTWVNPDTDNQYTVVPTRTYAPAEGEPCREFTVDAAVGGKTQKIYGTACRQADGSWKVKN